jgi:hypothetical protein
MQRRIAYLVVTLITFSIGISAAWLCSFAQINDIESNELYESSILLASPPAKKRFTPTARACKPGWAQGYVSSDGDILSESGNGFSSPALANRELQKWIKKAEKIIERAPKFDSSGKKIGERVIAVYPPNANGTKWVSIIWTDKTSIGSINAHSLQLALEFERTPHDQLGNMLDR